MPAISRKAIKGYLVYLGIEFARTHDLRVLINLASENDDSILVLQEAADYLTPLSVEYRYPDDGIEPTYDEFKEAYDYAKYFLEFLSMKIEN